MITEAYRKAGFLFDCISSFYPRLNQARHGFIPPLRSVSVERLRKAKVRKSADSVSSFLRRLEKVVASLGDWYFLVDADRIRERIERLDARRYRAELKDKLPVEVCQNLEERDFQPPQPVLKVAKMNAADLSA